MPRETRSKTAAGRATQYMRPDSAAASSSTPPPPVQPSPEDPVHAKCQYVLGLMDLIKMSLGDLVVAVCYGESTLRNVQSVMDARASLFERERLLKFLELASSPPRPPCGSGPRPKGASKVIREFTLSSVKETLKTELTAFSKGYEATNEQLVDLDFVSQITSNALHSQVKKSCPILYDILLTLTVPRPPDTEEVEDEDEEATALIGPRLPIAKHPHFDIVFQVTSMAYRLNPRRNMLQKILTIYAHAKHTGKAVLDLLQQAGLTMSYSWVRCQVSDLSAAIEEQTRLAVKLNPFLCMHDNIRIGHGVTNQRGDNQGVSDNATAATVVILPESARAFMDPDDFKPFFRALKAKRIAGTAPRLCYQDLDSSARHITNRIGSTYDILDFFAMIPELVGAEVWKSDRLKRPLGPQQLPHGREHRLKQFMLPVTNIDESTYSGNAQFIEYLLRNLGLDTEPERTRMVLECLIAWAGDRMTAQRCREVQGFRQESVHGFQRLESLLFIFGGLHCLMALAQAIIDRFRGSNVGPTFGADIITLSRTGLQKKAGQKRLDFHDMEEFLTHELEAHMRGLFNKLTGCDTSEARDDWVKTHSAEDLYQVAVKALTEHASSGALALNESDDELRSVIIMRQRDLLLYYSLRRAFKHGNIDRVEALLPELLYFFIGAGNHQYANEVYELLQLLTHETTPAIRAALLQHCLLVNKLGRADSFYPIDQRQELNNKGIRDYGPPPQNSSWEQYGKISRVIPYYLDIVEHVEGQITGLSRSHIHKCPKRELDVQALIAKHEMNQIHEEVAGREVKSADKAKDAMKAGLIAVQDRNVLAEYYNKREIFHKYSSSLQLDNDIETPPPSPPVQSPQSSHMPSPIIPTDPGSPESIAMSPLLDAAHAEHAVSLDDLALAELATRVAELVLEE